MLFPEQNKKGFYQMYNFFLLCINFEHTYESPDLGKYF